MGKIQAARKQDDGKASGRKRKALGEEKRPVTIWLTQAEKDELRAAAGRVPLSPFVADRVLSIVRGSDAAP